MDLRDGGPAPADVDDLGLRLRRDNLQSHLGESGLQIVRVQYGSRFDFGIQMVEQRFHDPRDVCGVLQVEVKDPRAHALSG